MSYYLEPWQFETAEAIEIVIGTTRAAWTVDDDVFIHTGDTSEREDGYKWIGTLAWEELCGDDGTSQAEEEAHNEYRLRDYVLEWKRGNV